MEFTNPRYGLAYERLLAKHADTVFIDATRMPQEGELFSRDSPTFKVRFEYITKRIETYLDNFRASPLYRIGEPDRAEEELAALDDCATLYAMGGTDVRGVEALAKAYVQACKRPEPKLGNEEPPTDRERKKNTYHYTQYQPTRADYAMRRKIEDKLQEHKRLDRLLYLDSVRAHKADYPDCNNPACPYCTLPLDYKN